MRHPAWPLLVVSALVAGLATGCRCGPASSPAATGARFDADPGGAPVEGGTLTLHVEAEPATLNPLVEHDAWTTWIGLGALYEPLVTQDPTTGEPRPALATSWTFPDPRTLELVLRSDVAWQDGHPFVAEDVAATFRFLVGPGTSPDQRTDFNDLADVVTSTPGRVRLRFTRDAPPLLLQSLAFLPILPAHGFSVGELRGQPQSRAPIGTGPFRFLSWRSGEEIVLERNPTWWGPRPHLDRVVLRIVRDREAAFELARRGEIDLVWRLTPLQVERALTDGTLARHRLQAWHLPTYSFIVWNTRRPGLGDPRVRRALTLLTDRARYLEVAYRGRAAPVTGPFPLGSASYDGAPGWPYDPAAARALLDQAGLRDSDGDGVRELDGKPFHIAFLLSAGSRTLEPLVTMLQEDLRRAGVVLDIVPVEWATLLDKLRHHAFDAASLQWNMRPVQDNYTLFHSSQATAGQNYGAFADPAVDQLLDELRRTPTGPTRSERDRRLHQLIHERQPYTFLGCPEVDSLVAPSVHGFTPGLTSLGLERIWKDGSPVDRSSGEAVRPPSKDPIAEAERTDR